jgi:hypothetical protein
MTRVAEVSRPDVKLLAIDQAQRRPHVDGLVKDAVEDTWNAMLVGSPRWFLRREALGGKSPPPHLA